MLSRRAFPFLALSLLIAGCGGSSGDRGKGTPASVAPKVVVAWPTRGRDLTAPRSALSAEFTLEGARADGTALVFGGDRNPGSAISPTTAAFTETFVAPEAVRSAEYTLRARFFSLPGRQGSVVATAAANVSVGRDGTLRQSDGTALGPVGFTTKIANIFVAPGQLIDVGATDDLVVTASDAAYGFLAVSPGSIQVRVEGDASALRANADGSVTGLAEGTATVVVNIDGMDGYPTPVTVHRRSVAVRSVALAASAMVYDATRNRFWAALPASMSVVDLDPETGAPGIPISVGDAPNSLAVSDDGSTLYVGLPNSHFVRPVDLASRIMGAAFSPTDSLGSGLRPVGISFQPGSSSTVAVTAETDTGIFYGPAIYDAGIRRPGMLGVFGGDQAVWTAPDRIVAYDSQSGGSVLTPAAVGSTGLTPGDRSPHAFAPHARDLGLANGRLFGSDGMVVDAATLKRVMGVVPAAGRSNAFDGVATDAALGRAYFVTLSDGAPRLDIYRTETLERVRTVLLDGLTLDAMPQGPGVVFRWGDKGLAIRTGGHVFFLDDVTSL